jgi:D-alanyl-D-alanine carboxypeptidase
MNRRLFLAQIAVSVVFAARPAKAQAVGPKRVDGLLETIRHEHKLPGIAAAAVRSSRIVAEGVAGYRRVGHPEKIELDDRFGMASCTKRMTATMVCRLIDAGRLSFETTLAEALPSIAMRAEYKPVTVAQLLTHRAGLPTYLQIADSEPTLARFSGSRAEKRTQFIQHVLDEQPIAKPGTEPNYSNAGYTLLGYVAEQRTGRTWETLMSEEIFQPLAMATGGFGPPRSKDRPDEPYLHQWREDRYEPEADDRVNLLEILAPAGDVHCSIRDFAKFAAHELQAAQGHDTLLRGETSKRFQELTRPSRAGGGPKMKSQKGDQRGKATTTDKGPEAGKRSLTSPAFFGGSQFISSGCMLWPDLNLAVVVAVNGGGGLNAIREVMERIRDQAAELQK